MVLMIAHRGASVSCTENTVAAVRAAFLQGAECVEIDLRMTADNKIVVFHDARLERMALLRGKLKSLIYRKTIHSMTSAEIKKVLIKGNEQIPLLEELLEKFPGKAFDFEIKEIEVVPPLYHFFEKYDLYEKCFVSSFHGVALKLMKLLSPRIKTGLLIRLNKNSLMPAIDSDTDYLIVHNNFLLTKLMLPKSRSIYKVIVYAVNNPKQMATFINKGVHGIITDRPEVLYAVVNK